MRNIVALLGSVALSILLAASSAFAPVAEVPEPISSVLISIGIGAAGLYAVLKRRH